MDFDTDTTVNEEEIDALGIKKKDDADIDVDVVDAIIGDDTAVDPDLIPEEEKESTDDENIFGVDKDIAEYMFSQNDHE